MKENLILVNYKVESEAYQALSELKRETTNANYIPLDELMKQQTA